MPVYVIKKRRQLFGKVREIGEQVQINMEYDQVPADWKEFIGAPEVQQTAESEQATL